MEHTRALGRALFAATTGEVLSYPHANNHGIVFSFTKGPRLKQELLSVSHVCVGSVLARRAAPAVVSEIRAGMLEAQVLMINFNLNYRVWADGFGDRCIVYGHVAAVASEDGLDVQDVAARLGRKALERVGGDTADLRHLKPILNFCRDHVDMISNWSDRHVPGEVP